MPNRVSLFYLEDKSEFSSVLWKTTKNDKSFKISIFTIRTTYKEFLKIDPVGPADTTDYVKRAKGHFFKRCIKTAILHFTFTLKLIPVILL